MIYIRFASHRARDYALRTLDRKPQAYWSLRRSSGKGIYAVTEAELETIRTKGGQHAQHFTQLRAPYDDLGECWNFS